MVKDKNLKRRFFYKKVTSDELLPNSSSLFNHEEIFNTPIVKAVDSAPDELPPTDFENKEGLIGNWLRNGLYFLVIFFASFILITQVTHKVSGEIDLLASIEKNPSMLSYHLEYLKYLKDNSYLVAAESYKSLIENQSKLLVGTEGDFTYFRKLQSDIVLMREEYTTYSNLSDSLKKDLENRNSYRDLHYEHAKALYALLDVQGAREKLIMSIAIDPQFEAGKRALDKLNSI